MNYVEQITGIDETLLKSWILLAEIKETQLLSAKSSAQLIAENKERIEKSNKILKK